MTRKYFLSVGPRWQDSLALEACRPGFNDADKIELVKLLLSDARVKTKVALELACEPSSNRLDFLKWVFASGRSIDKALIRPANPYQQATPASVVPLINQYNANPEETRQQIRDELGIQGIGPNLWFHFCGR